MNLFPSLSEQHDDIRLSPEEKAQQFLLWAERHVSQAHPLDDAISRVFIMSVDAQLFNLQDFSHFGEMTMISFSEDA